MNGVYDPNKGRKLSDEFTPNAVAPEWARRQVQEAKLSLRGKIGAMLFGALFFLAFGWFASIVFNAGPGK